MDRFFNSQPTSTGSGSTQVVTTLIVFTCSDFLFIIEQDRLAQESSVNILADVFPQYSREELHQEVLFRRGQNVLVIIDDLLARGMQHTIEEEREVSGCRDNTEVEEPGVSDEIDGEPKTYSLMGTFVDVDNNNHVYGESYLDNEQVQQQLQEGELSLVPPGAFHVTGYPRQRRLAEHATSPQSSSSSPSTSFLYFFGS